MITLLLGLYAVGAAVQAHDEILEYQRYRWVDPRPRWIAGVVAGVCVALWPASGLLRRKF